MRQITLNGVCGFSEKFGRRVVVLDMPKRERFYVSNGNTFNLPKGTYEIHGDFNVELPVSYQMKRLPKPKPKQVNGVYYVFEPTPHKAYISPSTGKIIIDPVFWSGLNRCERDYVIFHELGHLYYYDKNDPNTEKYADNYATNCMLMYGYNPTQINAILPKLLNNPKDERVYANFNTLNKLKQKDGR